VTCVAPSGSVFALGTHPVTCSAQDSRGNSANAGFKITVQDTTAPTIAGLFDQVIEATSPSGAVTTFDPTASDAVDPSVTVSCAPASGSTFALGPHTVNCTATDDSGNAASGSFTITVRDTTAPTLHYPGYLTAEATGPGGAAVPFSVWANDIVDTNVEVNWFRPLG
jgi:hypothetical protein